MKKILSIVFVALLSTAIFAQEESAPVLPKAGDIAIGIDATPFLDYAGNLLSAAGTNTLNLGVGCQTLYGRYYIADDAAIRFSLNVNNTAAVTKTLVTDQIAFAADPLTDKTVTDEVKTKNNSVGITIGYQKFRGEGKLRGFYGGQIGYTYAKAGIVDRVFGNDITSTYNPGVRILESTPSATSTIGLGGVIGVEYYIAPKICVGLDLNLTWAVTMANSYAETTVEYWDGVALKRVEETSIEEESAGEVKTYNRATTTSVGTAAGGNIYVMFAF